jgi:hypothetical protein
MEVSCGAAGIVRAGSCVVLSAAIAGKPAPTVIFSEPGFMCAENPCGSWLASDPPQAAIKKRRWLNQPTAFFLKLQSA